jgi:hypothetical protein
MQAAVLPPRRLAQDPLARVAEGLPIYSGSTAAALEAFGADADALRALLAEHSRPSERTTARCRFGRADTPAYRVL